MTLLCVIVLLFAACFAIIAVVVEYERRYQNRLASRRVPDYRVESMVKRHDDLRKFMGCESDPGITNWIRDNYPKHSHNRRQELLLACERKLSELTPEELERAARWLHGGCPVEYIV